MERLKALYPQHRKKHYAVCSRGYPVKSNLNKMGNKSQRKKQSCWCPSKKTTSLHHPDIEGKKQVLNKRIIA